MQINLDTKLKNNPIIKSQTYASMSFVTAPNLIFLYAILKRKNIFVEKVTLHKPICTWFVINFNKNKVET